MDPRYQLRTIQIEAILKKSILLNFFYLFFGLPDGSKGRGVTDALSEGEYK